MKKWTEEEIEWLKENFPHKQFNEMEQYLNRSCQAITKMAHRLKIKRDELVYKNFTKEQVLKQFNLSRESIGIEYGFDGHKLYVADQIKDVLRGFLQRKHQGRQAYGQNECKII